MGLIVRQSIKQSSIHFVGVAIGALSTLFIYPQNPYIYGLARFLLDAATFLAPFALFGMSILPIRFFPKFKDPSSNHNGFLLLVLGISFFAMALFALVFFLSEDAVLAIIKPKDPTYSKYFYWIMPLTILSATISLLYNYTSNFARIAVPYIFSNFFLKIGLPAIILLIWFEMISLLVFMRLLTCILLISSVGLLLYLNSLGQLKISKINTNMLKKHGKEMSVYALFGLLGSLGGVMAFKIDSLMISSLKNFESNGIYNIGLYISNIISTPTVAIAAIAGPIISEAWDKGDKKRIGSIYRDSSIMLLIFGFFAFLLIMYLLSDIMRLYPSKFDFSELRFVILFLALSNLVDMATSVNNQIIIYSDYYKFNLVAMILLGVFNVCLNYYLLVVQDLGITGVAIATSLSLFLFNLIKFIFIYYKFDLQPFSWATVKLLSIAVVIYFIITQFDFHFTIVGNVLVKGLLITVLYLPTVYLAKISAQYNGYIDEGIRIIRSFSK
jgi:O-antigen/teichoic acid export membrane protein